MKNTQKYLQYILILLIVVIAGCAYYFGYMGYIEKANGINQSNKTIENRLLELSGKETHRSEWAEQIALANTDTKAILAKYGPGNTPEKEIMLIRDLENAAEMTVSSITFSNEVPLFISENTDENGVPVTELDTTLLSFSYQTTYEGLKKCMDFINTNKERMNVSNFSASTNQETGLVTGNMVLNLYGVKDADHVYEEPFVPGISTGVKNIFGAIESKDLLNTDFTVPENITETQTTESTETGETTTEPADTENPEATGDTENNTGAGE